jgi:nitroimidazol reductase NimA-like FMN-containing flavoprotein (pyridoxamine 5'-phosphate oxidase superfamily)
LRRKDGYVRRAEQEIRSRRDIDAVIRESRVCRLGLADANEPYVVPLCFGYDGGTLYFHGEAVGRKLDIIKSNDRACVEFDVVEGMLEASRACSWGIAYRSVIAFGKVRIIEDLEGKRRALARIMEQYSDAPHDFPEESVRRTTIIAVDIERLSGKCSPAKQNA